MSRVLVVARHGSYDAKLDLNDNGKKEMKLLAEAVRRATNGHGLKTHLLCSSASRAKQGGRILMDVLGIPEDQAVFHDCLYVDNNHRGDWETTEKLVEETFQEGTLVIVISHLGRVNTVASLATRKLGVGGDIGSCGYGEGWIVTRNGVARIP